MNIKCLSAFLTLSAAVKNVMTEDCRHPNEIHRSEFIRIELCPLIALLAHAISILLEPDSGIMQSSQATLTKSVLNNLACKVTGLFERLPDCFFFSVLS